MTREQAMTKQQPQSLVQSDQRATATPPCDIYENDDEVMLVADLPGVAKDGLDIRIDKGELTLVGRRDPAVQGNHLGLEYQDCDYLRRFTLPAGIDDAKIRAELKNGVLQLHLPKSESLRPRQISVKAG